MKRFCFALDLKSDPELIEAYEQRHQDIWPEIRDSILQSGIQSLEIYRIENRLFMIMDTSEDFTLESKTLMDAENPVVQEWEQQMWKYQQALSTAKAGEKWIRMKEIFNLRAPKVQS
jgi:L-rhamnose mutarotase